MTRITKGKDVHSDSAPVALILGQDSSKMSGRWRSLALTA
jgi:hypothetical protein